MLPNGFQEAATLNQANTAGITTSPRIITRLITLMRARRRSSRYSCQAPASGLAWAFRLVRVWVAVRVGASASVWVAVRVGTAARARSPPSCLTLSGALAPERRADAALRFSSACFIDLLLRLQPEFVRFQPGCALAHRQAPADRFRQPLLSRLDCAPPPQRRRRFPHRRRRH